MDAFPGFSRLPSSIHKYTYVHGSPIGNIDPSGHVSSLAEFSIVTNAVISFGIVNSIAGGFNYADDGRITEHFYEFDSDPICNSGIHCTRENVFNFTLQFPAPSPLNPRDPPISHGEEHLAWGMSWGYGVPMGLVVTTIDSTSFALTNRTIFLKHLAHAGTVYRSIEGSSGLRIKTIGEGANYTPVFAFLNDKFGELAFRDLNRQTIEAWRNKYGD